MNLPDPKMVTRLFRMDTTRKHFNHGLNQIACVVKSIVSLKAQRSQRSSWNSHGLDLACCCQSSSRKNYGDTIPSIRRMTILFTNSENDSSEAGQFFMDKIGRASCRE